MTEITFACGTPFGGALDSTAALSELARQAGHHVRLVVAATDPYRTRPRTNAALVRLTSVNQTIGRGAWKLHDRIFRSTTDEVYSDVPILRASDVPSAIGHLHGEGGIIVANSIRRLDLERLIHLAQRRGSRLGWYLREVSSLDFVATLGPKADVLIANSRPLAVEAERLAGRLCPYIPSVLSVDDLPAPVERRSILMVNPIESHGLELVLRIAEQAPNRHFVLQESWLLGEGEAEELERRAAALPNVEFRRKTDRRRVFRDARVMISAHSADAIGLNRPRVALESQILGVPMVAAAVPGLKAVAASADLLVPEGATVGEWLEALDRVDTDYEKYQTEAKRFAERELISPAELWDSFAEASALSSRLGEGPQ
jgi:glycosyltransferase involved in cell wall biosynthesis